ncbi:AAA family ATPase [Mycolicibacterium sp.]|uniref:MinD/ParA family ATP-binding protein n=1 Tax=Mycolicibacterium sp. TaxID=2320850 RepID=UPI003D0BC406
MTSGYPVDAVETDFTASAVDPPTTLPTVGPPATELGLRRRTSDAHRRRTGTSTNGWGLGGSSDPADIRALADRINRPVRGTYSIAVLSLKGGVGKTTTTVGLGATFASLRGDRVIAVDANPDFGTLAQRGADQSPSTVRDVLTDQHIHRYSDIRRHTSQSPSRLEVLGSERDPAVSEAFSEADYRAVHNVLDRFYNIIITDCGTGLTHSAMHGVLGTADALVVVASAAIDSARSALATLDWLQCHGHAGLAADATVVLSSVRPGRIPIRVDQLTRHFGSRVREVCVVPYDRHLAEGGEVSLELMSRKTRRAYMVLAASMARTFGHQRGPDRAVPRATTTGRISP